MEAQLHAPNNVPLEEEAPVPTRWIGDRVLTTANMDLLMCWWITNHWSCRESISDRPFCSQSLHSGISTHKTRYKCNTISFAKFAYSMRSKWKIIVGWRTKNLWLPNGYFFNLWPGNSKRNSRCARRFSQVRVLNFSLCHSLAQDCWNAKVHRQAVRSCTWHCYEEDGQNLVPGTGVGKQKYAGVILTNRNDIR